MATTTGAPNPKSIVHVIPFSAAPAALAAARAAAGPVPPVAKYTVLRTNEVDGYEKPIPKSAAGLSRAAAAAAPPGDDFAGKSRKASKISIADATTEKFAEVRALIATLPSKKAMTTDHKPKITTASTSKRAKEERRNVRVDGWLYAASRENDNDFHVIIGTDPDDSGKPVFLNVEISGLPPSSAASFATLKAVRTAFKKFFGAHPAGVPGTSYDFYKPPVPVRIEGSLFFDVNHATGQKPGPQSLRKNIPTIWEIHPITKIVFEP